MARLLQAFGLLLALFGPVLSAPAQQITYRPLAGEDSLGYMAFVTNVDSFLVVL